VHSYQIEGPSGARSLPACTGRFRRAAPCVSANRREMRPDAKVRFGPRNVSTELPERF
jgi:hypothetical protein